MDLLRRQNDDEFNAPRSAWGLLEGNLPKDVTLLLGDLWYSRRGLGRITLIIVQMRLTLSREALLQKSISGRYITNVAGQGNGLHC